MSGRFVAAMRMTPGLHVEAVHLDEQLVERLLALVVAAAEPGAAMTADGVDLVDEDDRRARPSSPARTGRGPRDAPTPTNISTKSEPLIEKNGTPASPATALASSVLPVPGGPKSSTPFGIFAPMSWNFAGRLEELLDLLQLLDRLVEPGDVGERGLRLVLVETALARDLPNPITRLPPPCTWLMKNSDDADQQHERQAARARSESHGLRFWLSTSNLATSASTMFLVSCSV